MAKYLDSNGLSHFMTLIKSAFTTFQHKHAITKTTGTSATVTAGSAASLSTNTKTIPNVTGVGSLPTLGTPISITPVTKKTVVTGVTKKTVVTGGTKTSIPNISVEAKSIPNVTSVGSVPSGTYTDHQLVVNSGSAPTLGTEISVGSASAGTAIEAYTDLTTGDSVTVTTGDSVTAGTAVSIPNVTGVGSLPTLGDPITVKEVDTFTANTPTAVTPKTVVTNVDEYTGSAVNV